MNKSYVEWLDYYENATKEDVIQDLMLDINSIKEKNKEIERLNNIIKRIKDHFIFLKINSNGSNKEFFEDIIEMIEAMEAPKEGY